MKQFKTAKDKYYRLRETTRNVATVEYLDSLLADALVDPDHFVDQFVTEFQKASL